MSGPSLEAPLPPTAPEISLIKPDNDRMKLLNQLLSIQEISQKCGVPKSTLRFWEKQLEPLLSPLRSPGGQRRYSQAHVELIDRIKQLQADGLSLNEMRQELQQTMTPELEPAAVAGVERLADRVAGLIKEEVYRFFREVPPIVKGSVDDIPG